MVFTSSSSCLEEFGGSNLRPAVALRERGVSFHRSLGMTSFDFLSNSSIE